MLKTIAALGLGAALALSPLAALAQTDQSAAPAAAEKEPMKAKPKHHHMSTHHMAKKKPMEPAAPAAPAEAPKS